jgi:hypothetical protein
MTTWKDQDARLPVASAKRGCNAAAGAARQLAQKNLLIPTYTLNGQIKGQELMVKNMIKDLNPNAQATTGRKKRPRKACTFRGWYIKTRLPLTIRS